MKRAGEGNEPQQQQQQQQQQQGVMPTLEQVAKEERFASLRALLQQVAETPVDQLLHESQEGTQLREIYMEKAKNANLEETWLSFVVACRAAAEQRKRGRLGGGDEVASSDSPIKLPEAAEQDLLFGKGNILDRVYAAALRLGFPIDDLILVEPKLVQPHGAKIALPASVNANEQPFVDLRLPHENALIGEEGPLFDMREDVLKVIDGPQFGHVLLIGSSGCGKTTTAFLVAQQRYCVFMECYASAAREVIQSYGIDADALKKLRGDQLKSIKRRLTREVLARCVLLAILHKKHKISPYQWLLLSISDNKVFSKMLESLREVFNGTTDKVGSILGSVESELQCKPSLIIDEAHLLVEEGRSVDFKSAKGTSEKADTFGAAVIALSQQGAQFASCIWIGTQVSLEQSARLTSASFKIDREIPIYSFCSFPYIKAKRFAKLSDRILGKEFGFASNLLYGRARALATLICNRVRLPDEAPEVVVGETRKASRLVQEIERVMKGEFGVGDLLDLWMAAMCYDNNGDTFSPTRHGGTLPFTRGFAKGVSLLGSFKTGGQFPLPEDSILSVIVPRMQLSFVHVLDEPSLVWAIERYLASKGGDAPYVRLFHRAVDKCVNFKGEPSIRGQLLDVAVLCKVVSLGKGKLSSWLPLENACFASVKEATFEVTRVVSGKGVFYRWLEAVLNRPEEEFMPGVAAKNVCVRPEVLAGADGAFAAFLGKLVVIVTVACAWYTDGVTKGKWEDQANRSSDLLEQFTTKKAAKANKKPKKSGKDPNAMLVSLLNATSPLTLRVLVELPKRQGMLPPENVEGGALVVDVRNVETVLCREVNQGCF